jgi:hypothetical protein
MLTILRDLKNLDSPRESEWEGKRGNVFENAMGGFNEKYEHGKVYKRSASNAYSTCSIQMPARLSSTLINDGCLGADHVLEQGSPPAKDPVHWTWMLPSDAGGWHRQDAMHLQVPHWSGNGHPLGRIVLWVQINLYPWTNHWLPFRRP